MGQQLVHGNKAKCEKNGSGKEQVNEKVLSVAKRNFNTQVCSTVEQTDPGVRVAWGWYVSHRGLSHFISMLAAGPQWETAKRGCSSSPSEPTVTRSGRSSTSFCMPWDSGMSSHGLTETTTSPSSGTGFSLVSHSPAFPFRLWC